MSQSYKLPEVPPALSAEQMQAMPLDELKAEKKRRYEIMHIVDEHAKLLSSAWHAVYTFCEKREYREKLKAEIMSELQASLPPQPQPESEMPNETTATN